MIKQFYFNDRLVAKLEDDVLTITGRSQRYTAENDDTALVLIFAISSRIPEDCSRDEFLRGTRVVEVSE